MAAEPAPGYQESQANDDDNKNGAQNEDEKVESNTNNDNDTRPKGSRQISAPAASVAVSFKKKNSLGNEKKSSKHKQNADNISLQSESNTINTSNNSHMNNSGASTPGTMDSSSEQEVKSNDKLLRAKSLPANVTFDPCREFDSFAGDWVDSKGQPVIISAWGVIRYPNNPKLRFEAVNMGPNHLSVTFDRDPKKRKFVGKLNHDCNVLIWSNDTRWSRKGTKAQVEAMEQQLQQQQQQQQANNNNNNNGNGGGANTPVTNDSENQNNQQNKLSRQGSCIVM